LRYTSRTTGAFEFEGDSCDGGGGDGKDLADSGISKLVRKGQPSERISCVCRPGALPPSSSGKRDLRGHRSYGNIKTLLRECRGWRRISSSMSRRTLTLLLLSPCVAVLLFVSSGCNLSSQDQRERDEKTRDEVARATERAKPVIEEAGRKLGAAAHEAARQANAAAQGAREGWEHGPHALVDLNSASEGDLLTLPGISRTDASKIIAGRPYRDKHDLLQRGIVSASDYEKIRDRVTAK
jgi:DNA uptake protein ComE-like DNA-binding protein